MESTGEAALLEAVGVNVLRRGNAILRDVDFALRPGEIHALVGDHHSGKTAIGGLFTGAIAKTSGELRVFGRTTAALKLRTAYELGIAMLHQNSRLIPRLSVAENIFLGSLPRFLVDNRKILDEAAALLKRVGADAEPGDRTGSLPQPQRNLVELAGLLANRPRVAILDEVSRRFNPEEMERVYEIIGEVRSGGGGVIFISTSIDEIYEFADRVTILRDGRCRGTENVRRTDKADLVNRAYSFGASRESLRKSNIELHNYKKYNERILQNLPVGIVILDPRLRIHFMNQTALAIMSPDDAAPAFTSAADLPSDIAALLAAPDLVDEVVKFAHRDRLVQATSFPFDDTEGEVLGVILLLEDITRETQMKEHLIRAERVKSAAALASSLAHEINNPLCIMRNYLELAFRSELTAEPREHLGKIGAELDRIVDIVNNLLPFSRQQETVARRLDLNRLLSQTLELMRVGVSGRNIAIDFHSGETEIIVNGSENRLKQILVNLITNAIEAGDEASGVKILVSLARMGEMAQIVVADNGPGVSDAIVGKIFDPFFSSKPGRSNTGLGLSICQHIAESHHGLIGYRRRNGTSEFVVSLPLVRTK